MMNKKSIFSRRTSVTSMRSLDLLNKFSKRNLSILTSNIVNKGKRHFGPLKAYNYRVAQYKTFTI